MKSDELDREVEDEIDNINSIIDFLKTNKCELLSKKHLSINFELIKKLLQAQQDRIKQLEISHNKMYQQYSANLKELTLAYQKIKQLETEINLLKKEFEIIDEKDANPELLDILKKGEGVRK